MNDQAKNVPINIPIETDDDLVGSALPEEDDDDVIEIDGDAVDFDDDLDSIDDATAEAPIDAPATPIDAARPTQPEPAVFDPAVYVTDNDIDPYVFPEREVPPTTDSEPVAEEEPELLPTIESKPFTIDATVAPEDVEQEAVEAADAAPKSPEISREAVFEMMQELRQKSEQIARLTDEKTELYDRMLRRQAEFENFRKRGEREMQEAYVRARSDLVGDLLPIIDNFDLALHHAENASADVIHEGVLLIYKQLMDTLGRLGLEPIDAEGQPFDPEFHEAVATESSDEVPDHTVVSVLQRGFKLGDRMLRPARVKVAVQP